jgi:hypothetical protein
MRLLTTLTLCLGLVSAGCGGGSDPDDVLKEYAQALESKEWKAACDLLQRSEREKLDGSADGGCELLLKDYLAEGFPPDTMKLLDDGRYEVRTEGDEATVTPEGKGGFTLVRERGEWRLMNAQ